MRLLLDTHAMYWYIEGSPDLSATAQRLIQDASNDILISPASFWEMAIKISLGKWQLNQPYDAFVDIGLSQYGFQITRQERSLAHLVPETEHAGSAVWVELHEWATSDPSLPGPTTEDLRHQDRL
jgi:PIN domain nuclease of toxin-antitoxin system